MPDKIAFSINETARRIGSSRSSVYRLIGEGRLKAHKLMGRTIIYAADIDDLMASLPAAAIAPPKNLAAA